LFHALENEIDPVGVLLAHSAQPGQNILLFTRIFFFVRCVTDCLRGS
jgi:hypothetical protein